MYIQLQKERKIMKRIEVYKCDWCDKTYSSKKMCGGRKFSFEKFKYSGCSGLFGEIGDGFPYKIKISNGKVLY